MNNKTFILATIAVVAFALLPLSPAEAEVPSCISGAVYGDGTGWVQNDCGEAYQVGIASYKMVDDYIHTQILFDYKVATLQPGGFIGRAGLSIGVPNCNFQIDLFVGNVLTPPFYDATLIDAKVVSNGGFCSVTPPTLPPTADIKANGSDTPITIASGTAANLTWTSTNATACTVTPGGFQGTSGSASTGNLTASQTYTVNCTGAGGTASDSVTVNVTQQCVAPTVTTAAATNITQTSATLNGVVSPNGQTTTVFFEYGTSQSLGSTTATQAVSGTSAVQVTAQLTNLQPNTTYFFRLVAQNACGGANVQGVILSFTTGVTNAPTADIKADGSDGPITITSGAAATLTWSSTNATACTVNPGGFTGTQNSAGQTTGNLTASQTYTITCTGPGGSAQDQVTVNVTQQCVAPMVVTTGFSNVTQTSATVTGTVDPNGNATTVYFEYGTSQTILSATATQVITGNDPVTVTAQLTNLQSNTTYFFRLVAQNSCGGGNVNGQFLTFTTGQTQNIDVDIRANGQDGPITIQSGTSANITWTSQNATACTVSPTGWTGLNETAGRSTGNLTQSVTYTIVCTNASGQSDTDSVTVNVTVGQCTAPTVTTTAATNVTQTSATLNGVVTSGSQPATVFFEYGTTTGLGTTVGTQTVAANTSQQVQFTITGLAPNTTYFFRLTAMNGCGGANVNGSILSFVTTSGTGTPPTVTIIANPSTITFGQSSTLIWSSNNATTCWASGGPWSGTKTLSGSEAVTPSITSTYTITCTNSFGSASASATVFVTGGSGTVNLSVTKLVRNITTSETFFRQTTNAQGLDVLEFEIRVRNNDSVQRTVTVQDILPTELFYVPNSTTIDGAAAPDGITTSGLNLGLMNSGQERIVRFRTVVFFGTSERTITNQASANNGVGSIGTGFATIVIRNRGTVLGAADIVTGPGESLLAAIFIGMALTAIIYGVGTRRGWFRGTRIERIERDIEQVLADLAAKAQVSWTASRGRGK